jgi:hypothetical protein
MQLVLSSSIVSGDDPTLDGCFTEGRASSVSLDTSFVAKSSGVVFVFVRVVLRVELAVFVGGIGSEV